ncbi:hypothetical protein AB8A28_17440 [Tardiphaga sp. 71_E8_N1_1]|jgi:hypothetical protein|uniref:hypothetical protein n=1 Tax=Tardiphaga sp. 71_E8_N1_1 TaxID=3240784 RepID=UPI003F8CD4ED
MEMILTTGLRLVCGEGAVVVLNDCRLAFCDRPPSIQELSHLFPDHFRTGEVTKAEASISADKKTSEASR